MEEELEEYLKWLGEQDEKELSEEEREDKKYLESLARLEVEEMEEAIAAAEREEEYWPRLEEPVEMEEREEEFWKWFDEQKEEEIAAVKSSVRKERMELKRLATPSKYDIWEGLWAERITVNFCSTSSRIIPDTAIWELRLNDETVSTKTVPYEKIKGVAGLLNVFNAEIRKYLGYECTDWLRKIHSGSPEYTPPWERTIAVREFNAIAYTFDDDGNANRFEDECRGWLVFDKSSKKWFAWYGNRWEPTEEENVKKAARFVGRSIASELGKWKSINSDDDFIERYYTHQKNSATWKQQEDMITMAMPKMTVDMEKVSDPNLLVCQNGIKHRKTGKFYPMWECDQFRNKYPMDESHKKSLMISRWNYIVKQHSDLIKVIVAICTILCSVITICNWLCA